LLGALSSVFGATAEIHEVRQVFDHSIGLVTYQVVVAAVLSLVISGCGADQQFAPPSPLQEGSGGVLVGGSAPYLVGPCDSEGETRHCSVNLGTQGEVLTCVEGTQTCVDGTWSDCGEATMHHRQLRKDALSELAVQLGRELELADVLDAQGQPLPHVLNATASACTAEPCDPTCGWFQETPSGTVSLPAGPVVHNGSLSNLPNGLLKKGWTATGCETALDCQFGYYCADPSSDSSCGHNKCATGPALTGTCKTKDTCVAEICNNPTYAYCCTSGQSWDSACVQQVHDTCGDYCAGPGLGSCAHNHCYTGDALVNGCNSCVSLVCAANPSCCSASTGSWSSTCVSLVGSLCASSDQCGNASGTGQCTPWAPGQKDGRCTGVDLYLDVPCSSGSVPVCNAGSVASSGQFRVVRYAANSSSMPTLPPSCGGGGCFKGECISSVSVPAGGCVDVPCTYSGNNEELYVNPPAGPPGSAIPQLAECDYQNNWSIYNSSACNGGNCAPTTTPLFGLQNDVLFVVDRAASSSGVWTATQLGITKFLQESPVHPLNVALSVFPDDGYTNLCETTGASACTAAGCSGTVLGYTSVPYAGSTITTTINAVTRSLLPPPTPAAQSGAYLIAAADYSASTAVHKPQPIVVMILESDPTNCSASVSAMATAAANAYAANGTKTYVIGINLGNTSTPATIASAGHGKGYAYTGSTPDAFIQASLDDMLLDFLPCNVALPATGTFDPTSTYVYQSMAGNPTKATLSQVTSAAACNATSGGYYYDNNSTPTKISLCPASCNTAIRAETKTYVDLTCTNNPTPTTLPLSPYNGTTLCSSYPGTRVQWDYLAYNTTTPGSSYVTFGVQTGSSATALTPTTPTLLATAQASPTNTQVCALGTLPPSSTCPINLFKALDNGQSWGAAQANYLDLTVTLNPTSNGNPVVNSLTLTYSCPEVQ
jgi:hypothetical protein